MTLIIFPIPHPMIRETRLPNRRPRFQPIRKSSLDELHDSLQRNLRRRRQQRVHVIGHDHEFVEKEFSLIPIMRKSFDQKPGHCVAPENRLAIRSYGCDKEDAVGVHVEMVGPMGDPCL
jgi:hypothetical protein